METCSCKKKVVPNPKTIAEAFAIIPWKVIIIGTLILWLGTAIGYIPIDKRESYLLKHSPIARIVAIFAFIYLTVGLTVELPWISKLFTCVIGTIIYTIIGVL